MLSLVDTHIHIDPENICELSIDSSPSPISCELDKFIVPGVQCCNWAATARLAETDERILFAPGVHPAYVEQWSSVEANRLRELTLNPNVVAIGEIGLDGVVATSLLQQEHVLREQLQIAIKAKLPVLLHARQATGKLLEILRELQVGIKVGGIWHGFSGSLQVAHELVALGFKLGVGPILLRPNARKLPAIVTELPATALVLETDFPYMANNPTVLLRVAEKVAELRSCSLPSVAQITTYNAKQLLRF